MADAIHADVVVIGAGCAGLAAAVHAAAAGARVVVIDQAPRLGGRTTSFVDRPSGERLDNGQHVLFGCYRETYRLLEQIGAADAAPRARTLSLTMADARTGRSHALVCPDLPTPWHLALGLALWNAVPPIDRLAAHGVRDILMEATRESPAAIAARVPATLTVDAWLTSRRQPDALRRWLWEPLTLAALNQHPAEASARVFVRVLAELFASPHAAAVGVPRVPLDDLIAAPAVRFIEARGGRVFLRRAARLSAAADRVVAVAAGDVNVRADAVVSAVPWHAFGALWADGCPDALADVARHARAMSATPIVTVHLWFDRGVMDPQTPFLGIVGADFQWLFDRASLVGAGHHVSAVASDASALLRCENDTLVARAVQDARAVLPAARAATVRRGVVVREARAAFSVAPAAPPRPAARTALKNLWLAGDWTDTGLPATIEGAVRSGVTAAAGISGARAALNDNV